LLHLLNFTLNIVIRAIDSGRIMHSYHFIPAGLSVAEKTIKKILARAARLYEQAREEPCGSPELGPYVKRCVRWLCGGIYQRCLSCCGSLGARGIYSASLSKKFPSLPGLFMRNQVDQAVLIAESSIV
jgi:hypothetical protein